MRAVTQDLKQWILDNFQDFVKENDCYRKQIRSVFQTWMIMMDINVDTLNCDIFLNSLYDYLCAMEDFKWTLEKFEEFMYDGMV